MSRVNVTQWHLRLLLRLRLNSSSLLPLPMSACGMMVLPSFQWWKASTRSLHPRGRQVALIALHDDTYLLRVGEPAGSGPLL